MRASRRVLSLLFALGCVVPMDVPGCAPVVHALGSSHVATVMAHTSRGDAVSSYTSRKHPTPPPVRVKVNAGFDEQYRDGAWVPVRATLHNRMAGTISGTVEIADNGNSNNGPPQQFRSTYQVPVVIPGGATKRVILHVPSSIIQDGADVNFRVDGRVISTGYDLPTSFGTGDVSVGALSNDPADTIWLRHTGSGAVTVDLASISAQDFDTFPDALGNLDVIVLTDGETTALNHDQLSALRQYVHRGGSLVLVGGPGWQENLSPLPADLVPGGLTGTRSVASLSSLHALSPGKPPRKGASIVSVLSNPSGTILAEGDRVPLVVQAQVGHGHVLYLAFDPSTEPLRSWHGLPQLTSTLIERVAPEAAARAALPQPMQGATLFGSAPTMTFGPLGPLDMGTELSNVPAAALPSVVLFILLTVFYVLVLGPLNYAVLRRLSRREWLWVTVPVGSLACVALTFGLAFHLKGDTVLVNSVGVVELDGSSGPRPASLYLGLFAPVRGDYNLTYNAPALPATIPRFDYYSPGPGQSTRPLGVRLQEGEQTQVQFLSMNMWSMRDVALHSTINIRGAIKSHLYLDRHGYILGAVHNDTPLTLQHPAIIAGRRVYRLHDMRPEATISVRVRPESNVYSFDHTPIWYKLYGRPGYGQSVMGGQFGIAGGAFARFGGGFCCPPVGVSAPPEHSMLDRIRNVASRIPEAQSVSSLGEVTFIGWTTQPLGTITVDGSSPQRRDLTLVESPLSITLNHGPFLLRTGTFGARLVDVNALGTGISPCCGPQSSQMVALGLGGSATFEFDLPHPGRVHFSSLHLYVDAGGADGSDLGRVYDWHARHWVHEDLSMGYAVLKRPQRFVSPTGAILIKLQPGDYGTAGKIADVHQDIQISGKGVVS